MDADLIREINRIKNLKGTSDLAESEIERKAKINLRVRDFKAKPLFENAEEQVLAEERYKLYLESNEIESISDLDTLKSLIFNEVFETRIQKQLNKLNEEDKFPSDKLTEQLTKVQNQKLDLKVKLGIDSETPTTDELTGLQTLKIRCEKYINENKEEFTCICPHGSMMLLRRRVKDFDTMEHPWFAGRWLFNYEMLKDVKSGKLSKEDCWRYLSNASDGGNYKPAFDKQYCTDYIDYCLNHWAEITAFLENK